MPGTKTGGLKAAQKNVERDPNYYAKIGSKGGKAKVPKGFAVNRDLARVAGAKGGRAAVPKGYAVTKRPLIETIKKQSKLQMLVDKFLAR